MLENDVQKVEFTRKYLDPQRDPPEYVDEKLPTDTVKLMGPERRVRERAPHGTIPGSTRLTGSFYEAGGPGTYSLRVTRLHLEVRAALDSGTAPDFGPGTTYFWYLRHSRTGTADVLAFDQSGRYVQHAEPLKPLYAFGPGTLEWGFLGDIHGQVGTQVTFVQTMEGLLGWG